MVDYDTQIKGKIITFNYQVLTTVQSLSYPILTVINMCFVRGDVKSVTHPPQDFQNKSHLLCFFLFALSVIFFSPLQRCVASL